MSGPLDAVTQFEKTMAQHNISCHRLETSHAFHSSLMDSTLESFVAHKPDRIATAANPLCIQFDLPVDTRRRKRPIRDTGQSTCVTQCNLPKASACCCASLVAS